MPEVAPVVTTGLPCTRALYHEGGRIANQVPLSRHEEIKAKLQDANPRPAEQTGLNILQWDLLLAQQAKQELQFSFLLEHPRNMRLVGIA